MFASAAFMHLPDNSYEVASNALKCVCLEGVDVCHAAVLLVVVTGRNKRSQRRINGGGAEPRVQHALVYMTPVCGCCFVLFRSLFSGQWSNGMLPGILYTNTSGFPPPEFWLVRG